jgi:glycosylphosphatidylinositol transamidase (GPIT) subunit GPI8
MNDSLPSDVWVVIVSASVHWHNYRHLGNAVNLYAMLRARHIPDTHIIFFNALDAICSPHIPYPASMYMHVPNSSLAATTGSTSAFSFSETPDKMIDYHGNEVSVDSFLRALLDRPTKRFAGRKRLRSNSKSHVLIYLSGHGGNEFFKFRDREELSTLDFSSALDKFSRMGRYQQLMVVVDTCQAESLKPSTYIPNMIFIGSSRTGENSYAYANHPELGVAYIDRFTYFLVEFVNRSPTRRLTAAAMMRYLAPEIVYSRPFFFSSEGTKPEDINLHAFVSPERLIHGSVVMQSAVISSAVLQEISSESRTMHTKQGGISYCFEDNRKILPRWSSELEYVEDVSSNRYSQSLVYIFVAIFVFISLRSR